MKVLKKYSYINIILLMILSMNIFVNSWVFNRTINASSRSIQFVLINFGTILLLLGFLWVLPNKYLMKAWLFLGIFVNILLIANVLFYSYYNTVLSINIIKNIKFLGGLPLFKTINSLSNHKVLAYIIIMLLFYITVYVIINTKSVKSKSMYTSGSLIISFIYLLVGLFSLKYGVNKIEKVEPYALTGLYNREFVVKNTGLLYYHLLDFGYNKRFSPQLISTEMYNNALSVLSNHNEPTSINNNIKFGQYAGKNVIILQVESLQDFVVGLKINGQAVTPNIDNLIKESIRLINLYPQTSLGNTSDAEFTTNTSLLPLQNEAVYMTRINKDYQSLPKLLKEKGYFTSVLHANTPNYWNRLLAYKSLGFDNYENVKSFKIDITTDMGLSDISFLKQSVSKFNSYQRPFYAFTVTLTSHFPFNEKPFKEFNVGDLEGSIIGNYIQAAHYTDKAIGQFISELKSSGLYDDSILIIYGDHQAIPYSDYNKISAFLREPYTEASFEKNKKVFGLIHLPNQNKAETIDFICGQADILPTISYLLGIDYKISTGTNIFSKTKDTSYVIFKDGSFIYNNIYYSAKENKAYNLSDYTETNIDKAIIDKLTSIKRSSDIYIKK